MSPVMIYYEIVASELVEAIFLLMRSRAQSDATQNMDLVLSASCLDVFQHAGIGNFVT